MRMKNHFHIKGRALNLVLIHRPGELGNGLFNDGLSSHKPRVVEHLYRSTEDDTFNSYRKRSVLFSDSQVSQTKETPFSK